MIVTLSEAQRLALLWLEGEATLPPWYDTAHLNTLKALERKGLVHWHAWTEQQALGPRSYWVEPVDNFIDHYGPVLTGAGERAAATVRAGYNPEEYR